MAADVHHERSDEGGMTWINPDTQSEEEMELTGRTEILLCNDDTKVSCDRSAVIVIGSSDDLFPNSISPSPAPSSSLPDPESPSAIPSSPLPDPVSPSATPSSPLPDPVLPSAALSSPIPDPVLPLPDPVPPSPAPGSPLPDPVSPLLAPSSPLPDPVSLSHALSSPLLDPASSPNSPLLDPVSFPLSPILLLPDSSPLPDPTSSLQDPPDPISFSPKSSPDPVSPPLSPQPSPSSRCLEPSSSLPFFKLKDFHIPIQRLSKRKLCSLLRPKERKRKAKRTKFVLDLSSDEEEKEITLHSDQELYEESEEEGVYANDGTDTNGPHRMRQVHLSDEEEEEEEFEEIDVEDESGSVSRDELYQNHLTDSINKIMMQFTKSTPSSIVLSSREEDQNTNDVQRGERKRNRAQKIRTKSKVLILGEEGEEKKGKEEETVEEEEEEEQLEVCDTVENEAAISNERLYEDDCSEIPKMKKVKFSQEVSVLPSTLPSKLSYKPRPLKLRHGEPDRPQQVDTGMTELYPFYLPNPILKRREGDNVSVPKRRRPSKSVSFGTGPASSASKASRGSRRCQMGEDSDVFILRKSKRRRRRSWRSFSFETYYDEDQDYNDMLRSEPVTASVDDYNDTSINIEVKDPTGEMKDHPTREMEDHPTREMEDHPTGEVEVPTGEVEVPTREVDTLDIGGDENYIDVVDHSLEDLDQKIASHAHTRILRPQRTKEARIEWSVMGTKENPLMCDQGCQAPYTYPGRRFNTATPHFRGRRGPVPIMDASTQTGLDGPAHSSEDMEKLRPLSQEGKMGGSLWLMKEPAYFNLTSRCVPICTRLYKVLQKKHENPSDEVESFVGVARNHRYTLSNDIKSQLGKLQNLFNELKEVDIEWPFWRHVSVLAIAINRIILQLTQDIWTMPTFRTKKYMYHTTGVSTFLLGGILTDIGLVLQSLIESTEDLPALSEDAKDSLLTGYQMVSYVEQFIRNGCREPDRLSLNDHEEEEEEEEERKGFHAELKESRMEERLAEGRIIDALMSIRTIVPRVLSDIVFSGFAPLHCSTCAAVSTDPFADSFIEINSEKNQGKPPCCKICKFPLPSPTLLINSLKKRPIISDYAERVRLSVSSYSRSGVVPPLVHSISTGPHSDSPIPHNTDFDTSFGIDADNTDKSPDDDKTHPYFNINAENIEPKPLPTKKPDLTSKVKICRSRPTGRVYVNPQALIKVQEYETNRNNQAREEKGDSDSPQARGDFDKPHHPSQFVSMLSVLKHRRALKQQQLQQQLMLLSQKHERETNKKLTVGDLLSKELITKGATGEQSGASPSSSSGNTGSSSAVSSFNNDYVSKFFSSYTHFVNLLSKTGQPGSARTRPIARANSHSKVPWLRSSDKSTGAYKLHVTGPSNYTSKLKGGKSKGGESKSESTGESTIESKGDESKSESTGESTIESKGDESKSESTGESSSESKGGRSKGGKSIGGKSKGSRSKVGSKEDEASESTDKSKGGSTHAAEPTGTLAGESICELKGGKSKGGKSKGGTCRSKGGRSKSGSTGKSTSESKSMSRNKATSALNDNTSSAIGLHCNELLDDGDVLLHSTGSDSTNKIPDSNAVSTDSVITGISTTTSVSWASSLSSRSLKKIRPAHPALSLANFINRNLLAGKPLYANSRMRLPTILKRSPSILCSTQLPSKPLPQPVPPPPPSESSSELPLPSQQPLPLSSKPSLPVSSQPLPVSQPLPLSSKPSLPVSSQPLPQSSQPLPQSSQPLCVQLPPSSLSLICHESVPLSSIASSQSSPPSSLPLPTLPHGGGRVRVTTESASKKVHRNSNGSSDKGNDFVFQRVEDNPRRDNAGRVIPVSPPPLPPPLPCPSLGGERGEIGAMTSVVSAEERRGREGVTGEGAVGRIVTRQVGGGANEVGSIEASSKTKGREGDGKTVLGVVNRGVPTSVIANDNSSQPIGEKGMRNKGRVSTPLASPTSKPIILPLPLLANALPVPQTSPLPIVSVLASSLLASYAAAASLNTVTPVNNNKPLMTVSPSSQVTRNSSSTLAPELVTPASLLISSLPSVTSASVSSTTSLPLASSSAPLSSITSTGPSSNISCTAVAPSAVSALSTSESAEERSTTATLVPSIVSSSTAPSAVAQTRPALTTSSVIPTTCSFPSFSAINASTPNTTPSTCSSSVPLNNAQSFNTLLSAASNLPTNTAILPPLPSGVSSVTSATDTLSTCTITSAMSVSPYLTTNSIDGKIRLSTSTRSYVGLNSPFSCLMKVKILLSVTRRNEKNEVKISWTLPENYILFQNSIRSYEVRYAWVENRRDFTVENCRTCVWFSLGLLHVQPGHRLPLSVTMHNLITNMSYMLVVVGQFGPHNVIFSDIKFVS